MSVRSPEGEEFFPLDEAVARRVISQGIPVVLGRSAGSTMSIKEDETFLIAGIDGGIPEGNVQGLGFYHRDTRFLNVYSLRVCGADPILLSSSAGRGYLGHVDLTNTDVWVDDELRLPQQTVNVRRAWVLGGGLHERIRLKSYASGPVDVLLELTFGSDFADIFEVRGLRRAVRGTLLQPRLTPSGAIFAYLGQDDVFRQTRVAFSPEPLSAEMNGSLVTFTFRVPLEPDQTHMIGLLVEPRVGEEPHATDDFDGTLHRVRRSYEDWDRRSTTIVTDNEVFNVLSERSRQDLRLLNTKTPFGSVIAAGIPWYVAPFGRDSIIAAYEMLMLTPDVAAETLRVLARLRGRDEDGWRDEEPGKIFHEMRQGELAMANIIPHTPYYGSVDATPLFCMLAAAYFRWTNDLDLLRELAPALTEAVQWIDRYGDLDGDGFVEYTRRSMRGLDNQGWKDSGDAIVHPDGTPAEPPIALAEVQAYVYLAKSRLAEIFTVLGDPTLAERLAKDATELRERFNSEFWMPDEEYYALALDGHKRQVRTVTSNPAHGLYCGILERSKAEALARRLLRPDMFSGWGIRTMSRNAGAYNPMSYHNGSVWPHDNAIIAAGLKRYSLQEATNRVATGIFETAVNTEYMRLPELVCGFTRRPPNPPVLYPVACSPQAWSAGSVFLLLQAMLGISARAHDHVLSINAPMLPPWLSWVEIRDMRVGDSRVSLRFDRDGDQTTCSHSVEAGTVRVVLDP